ncbi:MAG: type II secretion system protein [Verrucomicrobiota bacterium]|nr:type II secretion system protein [Verrucomicrobiota bacterium]
MKIAFKLNRKRGFTLIELLVVIAIIGILAGLLFPAVLSAKKQAKIAQASVEVTQLATALNLFYNEYQYWPTNTAEVFYVDDNFKDIIAPVTNHVDNPRGQKFLNFPTRNNALDASGTFVDTFYSATASGDYRYRVMLDQDGDGKIIVPGPFNITNNASVAVWMNTNTAVKEVKRVPRSWAK